MKAKILKNNSTAFSLPTKLIRNSAKAIIIRNGQILCTKNRDLFEDFYLLPGGGQNHGETLDNTLKRECLEEIGAEIEIHDLVFVREYLSANHEFAEVDKDIHQVEFMFQCTLLEEVNSREITEADVMQTGVEWLPIEKLENFRFFPKTLIPIIKSRPDLKHAKTYMGDTN